MRLRLAAVQPRSGSADDEPRNAVECLTWIDRAADQGADLVLFPEGYPGPINPLNTYDAFGPMAQKAADRRVHVVGSRIEPAPGGYHITLQLIDDSGATAGVYRRTMPEGPYVYHDIKAWGFDYVESPAPPQVIETRLGRIGLLVCSEIYVPELSRELTLQGADVILYPAGGALNELLPVWRTMVWARAIENIVYTAATQNLYEAAEEGVGTIAGPEAVLAQSTTEGLLLADLDLDRLKVLRDEDERIEFPKRFQTVPGLLRWRRPQLSESLPTREDAR